MCSFSFIQPLAELCARILADGSDIQSSSDVLLHLVFYVFRYNALPDEMDGQDDDETGWKLVHADVFRPPKYGGLFAVLVGTGFQVCNALILRDTLFNLFFFCMRCMRDYGV